MAQQKDLGRLVAVYGIAPAYLQRAIFLAVLAFLFFLAMIFAFYIRQSLLYFLLSTAFLIVYLLTMFSWVMQRRASVEVYENGLKYRKNELLWPEILEVKADGEIIPAKGKPFNIPSTIKDFGPLIHHLTASAAGTHAP